MRVTFISPFPIFPPHGGNRARTLTLITYLREMGHQISFVLLDSRQLGDYEEAPHQLFFGESNFIFLGRNPLWNFFYYLLRAYKIMMRFLKKHLGLKNFNLRSVDENYYRPFTRQIETISKQLNADIVVVEYVQFSRAFDAFKEGVFKVLDAHDSAAAFLSAEEEAKGFRRADVVLAIQDAEGDRFRAQLGSDADRVLVMSHLLDMNDRVDVSDTEGVSFLGSSFTANIVSLKYFVDEVMPVVISKLPSLKLFVAGSICDDTADHPSIRKLGRVSTLSQAFKAAPISINPTRAGTGIKIKLLESMSHGIPVISTKYGVDGIDPTFLDGVVRVDDDDVLGFARAVVELAMNSALRKRLGECSYKCALRWNEKQLSALKTLLSKAEEAMVKADAEKTDIREPSLASS